MIPVEDLPYIEWTEDSGATSRVYADVVTAESVSFPATVTLQAVETGSKISDHYLPDPIPVKATLYFSGSPIRGDLDPDNVGALRNHGISLPDYPPGASIFTPGGLTNAARNLFGASEAASVRSYQALSFDKDPGRLSAVLQKLRELRDAHVLITIGTTVGVYDNMAMRDIGCERSPEDGDSGAITLDLIQISTVSSDVAVAVPLPLEPRAQAPKPANSGSTTPVDDPNQKTGLKALADKARGLK